MQQEEEWLFGHSRREFCPCLTGLWFGMARSRKLIRTTSRVFGMNLQIRIRFLSLRKLFLFNNSNFWCVRGSITCNSILQAAGFNSEKVIGRTPSQSKTTENKQARRLQGGVRLLGSRVQVFLFFDVFIFGLNCCMISCNISV